jgi:hypothetical protein
MKMGEESNSKQPNPNTMPVPKTVGGRDHGASRRVVELCGAVTPSGCIQQGPYSTGSDE